MKRNKILSSILAATMGILSIGQSLSSVTSFAEENSSDTGKSVLSFGDVDGNKKIDASDASMLLKEYSALSTGQGGSFSDEQKAVADIDGNGKIDASDASFILNYYSYISTGGTLSFKEYYDKGCIDTPPVTTTATAPVTTAKPPVTTKVTTTAKPPVTTKVTTTAKPPVTTKVTTTAKPPVTTKVTTTAEPPVTTEVTTTAKPPVTTKVTTTAKPPVTTKVTTTAKPPVTTKVTTTAKPPVTTKVTTTAKPPVTTKVTTTAKPPVTTMSATTTSPVVTADPKRVADIRISRSEMTLTVGTGELSAMVTMLPVTAEDVSEIWSSSDESIAIVDDQGWVQAVGEGKCTIRVTSADNPKVYAEIAVETVDTSSVRDIRISRNEMTLKVGEGDLSARVTMLPQTAKNQAEIWSCSNEEVAVVDNEGWVVGKKPGFCVVTVRSADNPAVFAVIAVNVVDDNVTTSTPPVATETTTSSSSVITTTPTTAAAVSDIAVDKDEIELAIGEKTTVSAHAVPDNAENTKLIWSSRSKDIANVDENGCITGVSAGTVVITVSSDENPEIKKNIVVTVTSEVIVRSIQLSDDSFTIPIGGKSISWVTMCPAGVSDVREMWTSSDTSIASVDRYGWITGISEGECIITVSSVRNPSVKAEIVVKVVKSGDDPEPSVKFSYIAPGKSDENNIAFKTPLPENYKGRYVIDYVVTDENGEVTTISSSTVVVPAMKSVILKLMASTDKFTATSYLTNLTNGKQAEIGTYEFCLSPRDARTLNENIENAFAEVQ